MRISIVIPAYNEEKYIGRTLESVLKLDKDSFETEIVVVDAESKDRTAEVAKSYGARVMHEPHKGIGFARQHGLKHASGEIVAFTDADTIVPKNWLIKHVEVLSRPRVVCSCGVFKVFDGKFPYYQYINYLQIPILWFITNILGKPFASGQNLAFWRKKAIAIGGFNDRLNVMEDVDLAERMKRIGRVVYSPNIVVYSSGRRSNEGIKFFIRGCIAALKYFMGKRDLKVFPDYR